jgi:two-component system response regulator AlgR
MNLKTLIVDDEALARSRLRTLLGDCNAPGAEVIAEASHAEQALQHLDRLALDLVLLDIHMPGMDGVEFIGIVAQEKLARSIAVVSAMEPALLHTVQVMAKASITASPPHGR